jgi:hypothetical protein
MELFEQRVAAAVEFLRLHPTEAKASPLHAKLPRLPRLSELSPAAVEAAGFASVPDTGPDSEEENAEVDSDSELTATAMEPPLRPPPPPAGPRKRQRAVKVRVTPEQPAEKPLAETESDDVGSIPSDIWEFKCVCGQHVLSTDEPMEQIYGRMLRLVSPVLRWLLSSLF